MQCCLKTATLYDLYYFCYFPNHSTIFDRNSKKTQHIQWNIEARSSDIDIDGPMSMTQNPSFEISFCPYVTMGLHVVLKHFFSMIDNNWLISFVPLSKTYFKL